MPRPKLLGSSLGPTTVADRLVPSVPTSKAAVAPISYRKYCNNNAAPSAQFVNALHEATNAGALFRTKEYFSCFGRTNEALLVASGSNRARWRFSFRTGPYHHTVVAMFVMVPTSADVFYGDKATQGKLTIYSDTAEVTSVGSATVTYGAHPKGFSGDAWGFEAFKMITAYVDGLSANTDYYGRFEDVNYGRLQSACVFELASLTEGISGYLPQNLTADSEVLSVYREKVAGVQKNLWKQSGAKVLSWSVDDGTAPITRAASTPANLIDTAVTTVSDSSPGFTIDMRGKDRLSQTTGVPVTIKVFCSTTSAGGAGRIYLKNSAGTEVVKFDGSIPVTTPGWISKTLNLPATVDKYDLQFDNNSLGTISVYAVSIYEYEA